eukprot:4515033-Pleurochrysis_carterae.AAC.1
MDARRHSCVPVCEPLTDRLAHGLREGQYRPMRASLATRAVLGTGQSAPDLPRVTNPWMLSESQLRRA